MRTVGAYEAKTKFSELLDAVERGERITITRHGKPVAALVPAEDGQVRSRRGLVEEMRRLRKGNTLGPGLTSRELIEEGRRY